MAGIDWLTLTPRQIESRILDLITNTRPRNAPTKADRMWLVGHCRHQAQILRAEAGLPRLEPWREQYNSKAARFDRLADWVAKEIRG